MSEAGDIFDGSDKDLAAAILKLRLLNPHQILQIVRDGEARRGTPAARSLADSLVEAGLVDATRLDALRSQTRASVLCAQCGKSFQISFFNPESSYACRACGGRLKPAAAAEPTIVIKPDTGTTRPPEATAEPTIVVKSDTGTTVPVSTPSPASLHKTTQQPAGGRSAVPKSGQTPPEVEEARKDPKHILGKYVIVKELGRGGTAVVYRAWDTSLTQYVALKIIKIEDADESATSEASDEVRDFQREARMSARLRHPNIVRIYELGCIDGKHYLSMELMEGSTFFEVIHGGKQRNQITRFPDDPEKFLKIFRDVARAVHYAHSQNPPVIHRDLKPQNVLMTADGVPCVADFGLAKEVDVGRTETVTGVVKGTPSYMAPEQAEGHSKDADQRTDVYSLGAILFEILTGRPPFVGDSVRHVLNQIVSKLPERPNDIITRVWQQQQASATQTGTTVSGTQTATSTGLTPTKTKKERKKGPKVVARQLETICLKALEKRKADRYPSAGAMADDVDRFLQNLEIEAREPGIVRKAIRKMRAHPIITGSVTALLMTAAVAAVAVNLSRRNQKDNIGQVIAIASDHEKARNWKALETDVESLRKMDPKNPRIAGFEQALKRHEEDLAKRRAAWEAGVRRLKTEPLKAVIEDLRAPFRQAEELKAEFWDRLERAILEIQTTCANESRDLASAGPNPKWLEAPVKEAARAHRELAGCLQTLATDPDFSFQLDPALPVWKEGLERILSYEGTWSFRVNVAPFAEVTLSRGGKEVAREFTPLGLRGVEVGQGYRVEICWPSRADPKQKITKEIGSLRHGAVVTVTGDISKSDVRLIQ